MSDRLPAGFEAILGCENVRTDTDPPLLLPPTEALLSETIRRAHADGVAVSVRGGGTAHVPDAAGNGIAVSVSAIGAEIEPSPEDFVVTVDAGVTPEAAETAVEKAGLIFPLDMGSSSAATVGGAFMTNARSAVERGYGAFRDSVIGVRCVSAEGAVITGGGRTAKNVTGYDLPRFFAGTMGLFGIAIGLTVKAPPRPESRKAVVARFHGGRPVADAVSDLLAVRGMPSFFEVRAPEGFGGEVTVALGFDGLTGVVDRSTGDACDRAESAGAASIDEIAFESLRPERRKAYAPFFTPEGSTVSFPAAASTFMMAGVRRIDETLPVLLFPSSGRMYAAGADDARLDAVAERSLACGGKLPVVYGRIRCEGIAGLFTARELELVRRLKRELDPKNILNPHLLS